MQRYLFTLSHSIMFLRSWLFFVYILNYKTFVSSLKWWFLVLFRTRGKMITKSINFRISRQKIKIFSTKYLVLILDENLTFKNHLINLKIKLNRANCLLAYLIRYYVKPLLLRSTYGAIFDSHLRYGCQIWGQTESCAVKNIETQDNKALRIINFVLKQRIYIKIRK